MEVFKVAGTKVPLHIMLDMWQVGEVDFLAHPLPVDSAEIV